MFIEEIEQAKKDGERASEHLRNEMELYFELYEKWKGIFENAGLEVENITITKKEKK